MTDKKFIDGLIIKKPENAPDFVIAKGSIKKDDFMRWLAQQGEWINFDIKESKQGKYYAEVNTWKPEENNRQQTHNSAENYTQQGGRQDDLPW